MSIQNAISISRNDVEESPSGSSRRGSHRLSAAVSCERLWWLRYGLGYRGGDDPDFRLLGTLCHLGLAYHYAAQMADPPGWLAKPLELAMQDEGRGRPDLIRTAFEVVAAYSQFYAAEEWKPVAVEKEFAATLGELDPGSNSPKLDDEIISCRTDLIVEKNGELWVVDHKTQSGGWSRNGRLERWKEDGEYRLNWQVMVNLLILRKRFDKPVRGFVINRVKRKAPYDFDRHVLHIPRYAYEQAPKTARAMVARELYIRARAEHGIPLIPNFAACYGRYGHCDFIDVCAAEKKEDGFAILDSRFKRVEVKE